MSGESRIARIAGTMVTWLLNTEKLVTPSSRARRSVSAVDGAVVSKPIAKKQTCLLGSSCAILSASSGEYTMRMSAPRALSSSGVPFVPGTRIMSPKHASTVPGIEAIASPSSTRPVGSTHTGQPGPCTSSTLSGRMSRRPWR